MNTTSYPDDDRGIFTLLATLMHGALSKRPESASPKPGMLERFDRWAARRQQRDREAYLEGSRDIFELERRIRELERRPYY